MQDACAWKTSFGMSTSTRATRPSLGLFETHARQLLQHYEETFCALGVIGPKRTRKLVFQRPLRS